MMRLLRLLIGLVLVLATAVAIPTPAEADAEVHEWIGTYDMNHDGHVGSLAIRDSKVDCASSAWCALVVQYTGTDNVRRGGTIETIDDKNQHMTFAIDFPDNHQKFDAYLFSWDKSKMAGVTYWGGRRFGFYATKKP